MNLSRSSVPERLNYVCVTKISDQAAYFYHERNHELYGIFTLRNFQHSGKGVSLFMADQNIAVKPITTIDGLSSVLTTG